MSASIMRHVSGIHWMPSSSAYFATAKQVAVVTEDFSSDCEGRRRTTLGPLFATSSEISFGVVIRVACRSGLYPHTPLQGALAITRSQDVLAIDSNRRQDTLILWIIIDVESFF